MKLSVAKVGSIICLALIILTFSQKNLLVRSDFVASEENCMGGECIYFWLTGNKKSSPPTEMTQIIENILPLVQQNVALYQTHVQFPSSRDQEWEMLYLDSKMSELLLLTLALKYDLPPIKNEYINRTALPTSEGDLCFRAHDSEYELKNRLETIRPSRADTESVLHKLLVQSKYQRGSFLEYCKREFEAKK